MYRKLFIWLALAIGLRILLRPALRTWNVLDNLATGQLVTETHLDQMRENIDHLGAMKFAGIALSALTAVSGARIATGSYVGNGADNRAITGVGFTPKVVLVCDAVIGSGTQGGAINWTGSDLSLVFSTVFSSMVANAIQSFNSDGFVVGTLYNANLNASTFYYVAIG